MYKGTGLTFHLQGVGFVRMKGESDWDFRRRVFPDLFIRNSCQAMEILFGGKANEWHTENKSRALMLFLQDKERYVDRRKLTEFAQSFPEDPLEDQKRRKADYLEITTSY